jgi:hypothetical protein
MSMSRSVQFLFLLIAVPLCARAEVGDPTLRTDHPLYAGEGAFQTAEDCVRFATQGKHEPQEQAIALYHWLLTHQFHLASPQGWHVPGKTPDTDRSDDDLIVFDANQARFSFGYALCGTVHAWNEPYWKALGMNARRRAFPGHVNSEVYYGGAWHAFDTDMAGLLFRPDGVVAGYDDLIKHPELADAARPPVPCYPFAWPADFRGMKEGWQEVARKKEWYSLYNGGFTAEPGIVRLRSGETFTRWFDRDHYGGAEKRRFWHNLPGGPFRNWTFVNQGEPQHREAESNCRGNASYCNGEFVYRPDLTGDRWREGAAEISSTIAGRTASPRLHSTDGRPAHVVFSHASPYVICGDPVDNANPMTGRATDGLVVRGKARGSIGVDVSVDQGQSWQPLGDFAQEFARDLTEHVKGRYTWLLRFRLAGDAGLDELEFTTVTQVAQPMYPRLKPGGSTVAYRSGNRGVIDATPNLGLPEALLANIEQRSMRSANVVYGQRSATSRLAFETTDNKPGNVVFRVDAPAELLEVSAAFRFPVRVPPPENCDFHLDVSTDDGRTWKLLGKAEIPADNEFSSGWAYGRASVADARVKSALVRMHFYGGGYRTGVIDARLYGSYRTPPPQSLEIEYGWREDGAVKTHVEHISANAPGQSFTVPTGLRISDDFVRLRCP